MSTVTLDAKVASLRVQVAAAETQLQNLREALARAETEKSHQDKNSSASPFTPDSVYEANPFDRTGFFYGTGGMHDGVPDDVKNEIFAALTYGNGGESEVAQKWPLSGEEYRRYGRQLIMPQIGLRGQMKLKNASVLIIGVGGLGCPAAAYLAGAGVGTIGLVDADVVEASNLHRQILHSTAKVGMSKVESATLYINSLNDEVHCVPYQERLYPENAIGIVSQYDIVLDCTDTPASRYLISDACVLLGKPLVSASALRTEGQLTVLNNPPLPAGDPKGGPCYRCIFAKPPPAESIVSCGDGGILGPVVGLMGVLQALETIKVLTEPETQPMHDSMDLDNAQLPEAMSNSPPPELASLLMFSAYDRPMFRSMRIRARKPNCASCSAKTTISVDSLNSGSLDYVQFCGTTNPVTILDSSERISADELSGLIARADGMGVNLSLTKSPIIIDVREKVQFELCSLKGSLNVPYSLISRTSSQKENVGKDESTAWVQQLRKIPPGLPLYVVCRLGNDSQFAVRKFKDLALDQDGRRSILDVTGGLKAWRARVDPDFPDY